MSNRILGISGSPIPNSNTDLAVQAVMEASGLEGEFIKLSKLSVEPCRACLGCKKSNTCVVRDDGRELAKKFAAADAFVLGGFTPYSSLDARTKTFMERMYCFRHQTGLNAGKVGAAVLTTAIPEGAVGLPPAAETAKSQIEFWMLEEGMRLVGTLVLMGNVPCIRCGHGDNCPSSAVKMIFGEAATGESVGANRFGDRADALTGAQELGRGIAQAIAAAAGLDYRVSCAERVS